MWFCASSIFSCNWYFKGRLLHIAFHERESNCGVWCMVQQITCTERYSSMFSSYSFLERTSNLLFIFAKWIKLCPTSWRIMINFETAHIQVHVFIMISQPSDRSHDITLQHIMTSHYTRILKCQRHTGVHQNILTKECQINKITTHHQDNGARK